MRLLTVRLCVAAAALSACGAPPSPSAGPAGSPTGTASMPATASSTSPTSVAAPPAEMIGVSRSGAIVIADASTGRIVRTLVSAAVTKKKASRLSHAGGDEWLYYTQADSDECASVMRVRLSGSDPERVTEGGWGAISADGRLLAWTDHGCRTGQQSLYVRDLTTGATRSWRDDSEIGSFAGIFFWKDSRSLVLIGCGADSCGAAGFDSLFQGRTLVYDDTRFADVQGRCCYGVRAPAVRGENIVFIPEWGDVSGDERYPLLEMDVRAGRIVRTLFEEARDKTPQDFDASSTHMLVFDDGILHRWSDGRMTRIGGDFTQVLWLE